MKSTIAKRMNKLLSLCLVLFACLALSATAFADPKTAKKYAREATKAYADGNYELALAKFEQAYAEDANPALLYNMGRVYENQANFDAAIESYKRFVVSPDVDQDARADALDRIKTLNEVIALTRTPSKSSNSSKSSTTPVLADGSCVNINTADATELMKLPRVGDSTAQKIINLRSQKGAFKANTELMEVSGIGEKTYAKLEKDLCPLGGATPAPVAAPAAPAIAPKAAKVAPTPQQAKVAPAAKVSPAAPAATPKKDLPVLEI